MTQSTQKTTRRTVLFTLVTAAMILSLRNPVVFLRQHAPALFPGLIGRLSNESLLSWLFGIVYSALLAPTILRLIRSREYRCSTWHSISIAEWSWIAIAFLTMLSTVWSIEPDRSLQRGGLFLLSTVFAVWIAHTLRPNQLIAALGITCAIGSVASWVVIVVSPEYGIDHLNNVWIGLFYNRNSLAPVAGLGLICGAAAIVQIRHQWGRISIMRVVLGAGLLAICVLQLVIIVKADSQTTKAGLAAAIAVFIICKFLPRISESARKTRRSSVIASTTAVALVGAAVVGRNQITGLFGRDTQLDGRGPIWRYTVNMFLERPKLGWGYYSIWETPKVVQPDLTGNWNRVVNAHNSFLELILGTGTLGLAVLVVVAVAVASAFVRTYWLGRGATHPVLLAILVFTLLGNLMETFALPYHYVWLIFVATSSMAFRNYSTIPARPDDLDHAQATTTIQQ